MDNSATWRAQLAEARAQLALCYAAQRGEFERRLVGLERRLQKRQPIDRGLQQLAQAMQQSQQLVQARREALPNITYPTLPISERREELLELIAKHQVVIIAGETGSGKTTQLPKLCLELGRGINGLIGHTQPRRIAARSVAARIAEELSTPLGEGVGYQVRFTDVSNERTYLKLMTDGILLAEIQHDKLLSRYDTLIIDEAHERSLNIDFLLGYLKQLLPRRPDLKLIITSATIDLEKFSEHFGGAPIIMVSGRTYPVDIWYRPPQQDDDDYSGLVIKAIAELTEYERRQGRQGPGGDVLVFLSGEREIRELALDLRKAQLPHTEILPLYARLSVSEQNRVLGEGSRSGRRIVLATNVAETSLTVPGIRYVIDIGTARISRYSPRTKVQRLPIEAVSQASANQRAGRCGRVADGICVRLYGEEDFQQRPEFTDAEILRTNLASVILQMLALGLGDVSRFPFVDRPDNRQITDGYKLLQELGAVDRSNHLTVTGRRLASLPLDPRLSRMVMEAERLGCVREILVITAGLSVQDPRERPVEKQQAADQLHRRFADADSDFHSYLKLWEYFETQRQELSHNQLRKLCSKEFLSHRRLREWRDIHHQLRLSVKALKVKENNAPAAADTVTRALLSGLLSHLGMQIENKQFLGARNRKFRVFPGSFLAKKPPRWVVAAELVETSQLFARTLAKIDPEWAIEMGGDLLKYHYHEPFWHARNGQVMASQRITLFGLVLQDNKRVNYGAIDPVLSHDIFVRGALVEGGYHGRGEFFKHNNALLAELEELEEKSRRRDIVADPESLYRFYAERIPSHIVNLKGFENWRKKVEHQQPRLLFAERQDVSLRQVDASEEAQFPDHIDWQGARFSLRYRFEPGHVDDGVSVIVPIALLNQVPKHLFEWLVPGMLQDKCVDLVKSLPKQWRKLLVPVPDTVGKAMLQMQRADKPLVEALNHAILRVSGHKIPADAWQTNALDPHYLCNFIIVDGDGQTVARGRDMEPLRETYAKQAEQVLTEQGGDDFVRSDITHWDFDELLENYYFERGGVELRAFPALVDCGESVSLELLENAARAARESQHGVLRLLLLSLPEQVKYLRRSLLQGNRWSLFCAALGIRHEQLINDLVQAVFRQVFLAEQPLPRTQQAFLDRIEAGRGRLIEWGNTYETLLGSVAPLFQQVKSSFKGSVSPVFIYALGDMKSQLALLFDKHFLVQVDYDNLRHYPRYLKAMLARQEKLAGNYQRDKMLMADFADLREFVQMVADGDDDLRWDIEFVRLRWMLEEYRVSVFAQQLGTAQTVSLKRLQQQRQKLS